MRILEENKCVNCQGVLELSKDRRKMVCPFCGSEFLVEMEKSEAFDVENVINPAFFKSEWDIGHIREKSNGKIFLREFMYCVNEIGTREGILDYVFSLLDKDHSSDLATEKHNFELYSKVKNHLSSVLEPGEIVYAYQNTAFLSKGKEGNVVTNKRTITYAKKVDFEFHKDIRTIDLSLGMDAPFVHVNERYDVRFGMIGSGYRATGAFAALICFCAFEENPDRQHIRLV